MECRQPAAAVTPWSAIYRAGLVAASGCSACARPMNAAMASRVLLPRGVVLIEPREVRATTVRSSCHDSFFFQLRVASIRALAPRSSGATGVHLTRYRPTLSGHRGTARSHDDGSLFPTVKIDHALTTRYGRRGGRAQAFKDAAIALTPLPDGPPLQTYEGVALHSTR